MEVSSTLRSDVSHLDGLYKQAYVLISMISTIAKIQQGLLTSGKATSYLSSWDYSSSEVSPFLGNFDGTYKFVNGLCA